MSTSAQCLCPPNMAVQSDHSLALAILGSLIASPKRRRPNPARALKSANVHCTSLFVVVKCLGQKHTGRLTQSVSRSVVHSLVALSVGRLVGRAQFWRKTFHSLARLCAIGSLACWFVRSFVRLLARRLQVAKIALCCWQQRQRHKQQQQRGDTLTRQNSVNNSEEQQREQETRRRRVITATIQSAIQAHHHPLK